MVMLITSLQLLYNRACVSSSERGCLGIVGKDLGFDGRMYLENFIVISMT